MNLAEYAEKQTTGTYEVKGPDGSAFLIRLRPVTQGDLIAAGANRLAALMPAGEAREGAPTDNQLAAMASFSEAVVCAGVSGQSDDGGKTWADLRVVVKREQESPARGAIHVSRLAAFGPGTVAALSTAILALSGMTQEAAEGLASFRRG